MNNVEKIKNIEFLRVVGCLTIVLHHFFYSKIMLNLDLFSKFHTMTSNGQKAVDLFFIISGFFFIYTYKKDCSLFTFLKKKIIRFWPVMTFVLLLSAVVPFIPFNFYSAIITFFGLNGTILIFKTQGTLEAFWYVSSMIWTFLLFKYLLMNYKKKNVDLFIAISIFLSYSLLINNQGGEIFGQAKFFGFINSAMCRAIGGIGIGYFIGQLYKTHIDTIKHLSLNITEKLFITVLEFCCLFFIINNLMLHKIKFDNQIVFIIVFALTIILFLIKQGYISMWLEKDIFSKIAKYTLSIYLTHEVIVRGFISLYQHNIELIQMYPVFFIGCYLICVITFGIATYYLIEQPAYIYLSNRSNAVFAERERERERESNPSSC